MVVVTVLGGGGGGGGTGGAQQRCPHPPLQCLFTVDEEQGLGGAFGLDAAALRLDAGTLVNLDTEEWGIVCV